MIKQDFLTINKFSRPGNLLKAVKGIVVHWVANPNSTAQNNRDYFESLKRQYSVKKPIYASAHYIIGLDGEIVQCIPDNEMAYHVGSKTYTQEALNKLSNYPNDCTVGIECCHIDWNGNMTEKTYNSLINLCVKKLKEFNLTVDNLWLHKEVVGWKDCHRWFVNNPNEWVKFKRKVGKQMNSYIGYEITKEVPIIIDGEEIDLKSIVVETPEGGITFLPIRDFLQDIIRDKYGIDLSVDWDGRVILRRNN